MVVPTMYLRCFHMHNKEGSLCDVTGPVGCCSCTWISHMFDFVQGPIGVDISSVPGASNNCGLEQYLLY